MECSEWDYYDEKLLKSLVIQYTFDFDEISRFYRKNFESKNFSAEDRRKKWVQMQKTPSEKPSRFGALLQTLPRARNNQDFLAVTPEDLRSQKTLLTDGTYSHPNGTRAQTKPQASMSFATRNCSTRIIYLKSEETWNRSSRTLAKWPSAKGI